MQVRRGRPRRGKTSDDEAIARTVERLIMWGFSGRGEVFETVGVAAKNVLGRTCTYGRALGFERIEQIWEQYRPPGWERYWPEEMKKCVKPISKHRWLYTKKGLRRFAPDSTATIQQLAETLLRNGGKWPWPTERVWCPVERIWEEQEISVFRGEPELSLKWAAQLGIMSPLRKQKK